MNDRLKQPAVALIFATFAILMVQLVRSKSSVTKGQQRAVVVAAVIMLLFVALAAEASPELATGFAALLFISVLIGGTNVIDYLTMTLPHNLMGTN